MKETGFYILEDSIYIVDDDGLDEIIKKTGGDIQVNISILIFICQTWYFYEASNSLPSFVWEIKFILDIFRFLSFFSIYLHQDYVYNNIQFLNNITILNITCSFQTEILYVLMIHDSPGLWQRKWKYTA